MEVGEISGTDGNPTRSVSLAARRAESLARDSDMLERALGSAAPLPELQRGDLLFWEGHVAIARDATMLVHANAFHMAVAIEPVQEAIARIAANWHRGDQHSARQ